MAKEFIVAIELGSSKVTGIAGQKNLDGSITVLAVAKEDSSSFIRKGVVYNIDKTAQCLQSIVRKLEGQLKTQIKQVYVGVGGQSVRGVRNVVAKDLPTGTIVTDAMIDELVYANRDANYPDQEIIDTAVQEYKVDSQYQQDPVGIQCTRLEGNYLNILQRKAFYKNWNRCFEVAGIHIAEMLDAPLALADAVLTEAERRSGCVLIDLGADTTTVSVYTKNILRHISVIPLGGSNITKDIATLQMEESDAEKMKLKYASAYTDNSDIDNNLKYSIDQDRQVESRRFIEIVEGRTEEIVENAWYQVPSEYCDKLLGGIILTGGGANLKNIDRAFQNHTHIEKIRIAKFPVHTISGGNDDIKSKNAMMCTVLGLLHKGDLNCAGMPIDQNAGLFGNDSDAGAATPGNTGQRPPRKPGEVPAGVVMTEAEKQKAEEEARLKREQEEREAREKAEAEAAEAARLKRQNSKWNKFKTGFVNFTRQIITGDD